MRRSRGEVVRVEDAVPVVACPVARPVGSVVSDVGPQVPQVVLVQLPAPPAPVVESSRGVGHPLLLLPLLVALVAAVALAAWSFSAAPWHEQGRVQDQQRQERSVGR